MEIYRRPVSASAIDDFFAGQRYEHLIDALRWREMCELLRVNVREGVAGSFFWAPSETLMENPDSRHVSVLWYQLC